MAQAQGTSVQSIAGASSAAAFLKERSQRGVLFALLILLLFAYETLLGGGVADSYDYVSALFYPAAARDRIGLILIDEETLRRWQVSHFSKVPPRNLVQLLNAASRIGATAVFLNTSLSNDGADAEVIAAAEALRRGVSLDGAEIPGPVPVFIGNGTAAHPVLAPPPRVRDLFVVNETNLSRREGAYSLWELDKDRNARPTVALELANTYCASRRCPKLPTEPDTTPMLLRWPTVGGAEAACNVSERPATIAWERALRIITSLGEIDDEAANRCAPFRSIPAHELAAADAAGLEMFRQWAGERIWLIGTHLPNDLESPRFGPDMPAVAFHATALENLLAAGERVPLIPRHPFLVMLPLMCLFAFIVPFLPATQSRAAGLGKTALFLAVLVGTSLLIQQSLRWPLGQQVAWSLALVLLFSPYILRRSNGG
jgi:hypothetical protein